MGGAQCLAHAAVDRREGETDACTAYMRHDSDTMEGAFTQCSHNDAAPCYSATTKLALDIPCCSLTQGQVLTEKEGRAGKDLH